MLLGIAPMSVGWFAEYPGTGERIYGAIGKLSGIKGQFRSRAAAACPAPGGSGADLVVDSTCIVGAGTYHYGDVNIIKGGSLQFSDAVINFWAHGILIENQGSLTAGVVGAASDGSGGTIVPIGTAGGNLTIHLYGKDEGTDGAGITCKSDTVNQCGVPGTADTGIWGGNAKSTPT